MANWAEGFVEVDDLKIHYTRTGEGSGKPAIVLMHGFTDNGHCWTPVALELEATYDVVMPDARGHGLTDGPVTPRTTLQLAEDTAGLIRQLGLEKPFLFGHSMGAITAATLAANHPDLVRAAVLEDPPFAPPREVTPELLQMMEESAAKDLAFQKLPLEERIRQGKESNPGWSEAEIIPWAESKGEYQPDIMNNRGAFRNNSWQEVVAKITCPTLLVTGDPASHAIVSPETAEQAAQLCPTLEVLHVEGAGHCIHRDRFDATIQPVIAFLAKN